jgi:hypothetical protein
MKFLIAGFGSIGRRHLRNLLALGERDILLLRSNKSTLPEGEIASFSMETSMEAALRPSPGCSDHLQPTALHLDVAIHLLRLGARSCWRNLFRIQWSGQRSSAQAVSRGGANCW